MSGASIAASRATARRAAGPGARLTLIDRYVLRQVALWTAAAATLIISATLLERTLRIATQMAAQGAHLRFLPAMVLDLVPHYVALGLPDAFLVGMLITLTRLDADLEIEAMLANGVSQGRLVTGLVGAGIAVAAVNIAFVGWFEPLGLYDYRVQRALAVEAGWTAEVQARALNARGGAVTLSADGADASGRNMRGVFIHWGGGRQEGVITARSGRLDLDRAGVASIDLQDGEIIAQGARGEAGAIHFSDYAFSDPYPSTFKPPVRSDHPQEMTLAELAYTPARAAGDPARSELAARLARTLVLPILPFLALPVAVSARRERRVLSLASAGMAALLFRNTVRLTQRMGAVGRVEPTLAMTLVFAAFALFIAWLFASNRRLHGDTPLSSALRRVGETMAMFRRPPRVRPRTRASVGGYLRGALAGSILTTWAILVTLLLMLELFERTPDIYDHNTGLAGLGRYALLRAPAVALEAIGLATAVGSVVCFALLHRSSELVVVRSLGVSLPRLAAIVLPVGLGLALAGAALAEGLVPPAQLAFARWWNPPQASQRWLRNGGELMAVRGVSPDGRRITGLSLFRRDQAGHLSAWMQANNADFSAAGWGLRDVSDLGPTSGRRTSTARAVWPQGPRPRDLVAAMAQPTDISAWAAWRALRDQAPSDLSDGYLRTRLHRALAAPLIPLVMLFLALPLAIGPPRGGPTARDVTWVLAAALLYWVADGVLTAAGLTSLLPPWLAAWGGPLVFGAVAASTFVRTEI